MKEFIDKLIERLEGESNNAEAEMHILADREYSLPCQYDRIDIEECKSKTFCEAISIVNELAEEYNKKQEHEVWLNGCDDDTIFTMEMTNSEYEFLKRVSELANETSTYGCMPRLFLDESVGYTPPYTEGE